MNLKNINRKFVDLIIDYCVYKFGYSKHQCVFPRIILYNRPCLSEPQNCGYYDYGKNVICIFKPSHKSCIDLVNTIVHEYVHYLQSEKKYYKLEKKHDYKDHPFEIEAYEIANKHGVLAKRYAKKLLKK